MAQIKDAIINKEILKDKYPDKQIQNTASLYAYTISYNRYTYDFILLLF